MGLDMYLSVREYIGKHDLSNGWENKTVRPEFQQAINAANLSDFVPEDYFYGANVSTVAAYWRKANAIHDWFVNNVQEGTDDCKEYYVSEEQLQELIDVCKDVLAHRDNHEYCKDILSPTDGFFFGSTDLDRYYFEDVEYTAKRLDEILALSRKRSSNNQYVEFTYQASW